MSNLYGAPARPDPTPDQMWSPEVLAAKLTEGYSALADFEKEALSLYEPQDVQAMYHACRAPNVILIGGTRAGKTLCGCIEDARCVTNSDPHGKYPNKGTLMLLGYGWNHVGRVFYPMLFQPGAFKIIRDQKTFKWRAYRPWEPADAAREEEAEDAPPLIPSRFYDPKDIAWESKGQNQFVRIKLNTGWEIWAFSSESDPRTAQGFRIQRIHVDEDLSDERWIGELTSRKAQDKGLLHWTAVPHSKNESMLRMVESAEKDQANNEEKPTYVTFRLPFLSNKHIADDAKQQALKEWASEGEDVLRMRSLGEFTYDTVQMYPTFSMGLHSYRRSRLPNREVPKDWTRFAAIDPGHQVMAVLYAAIPPTNDLVLVYDESYLQQCDAVKFGQEMERKCKGLSFYAFIMDYHGAKLRDIGGGRSPLEQYRDQLALRNIVSEVNGSAFIPGSTIKSARAEAVRHALLPQMNGNPRLMILVNDSEDGTEIMPATPNLVRTIKRYRKKQDAKDRVLDEPETRGDVHLPACLEYLMSYPNLQYMKPKPPAKQTQDWELIKKQHDEFLNPVRPHDQYPVVHFGAASLVH